MKYIKMNVFGNLAHCVLDRPRLSHAAASPYDYDHIFNNLDM
jgi:hypothetical protein